MKHSRFKAAIRRVAPWLACVLALLLGARQDPFQARPAPRFAGRSIPDPPRQGAAWVAPETKLPRFLVTATAALLDQGVADPRGCEYREVEVGDGELIRARGFVLPDRPGDAGRFVVCWDGVVRPAFFVGGAVDLDADVRKVAGSLKADKAKGEDEAKRITVGMSGPGEFEPSDEPPDPFLVSGEPAMVDGRSPIKLCLLLRLGRADLAEALFAGGTSWTPETPRRDLTDYGITYVTLANEWARAIYSRLLSAHQRGDDVIALDAARRLKAFGRAVDTRAQAMGFVRVAGPRNRSPQEWDSNLEWMPLLDPLLADQERRAKEPPRGPVPPRGVDPSARIAALIRDLDQVHASGMDMMGGEDPRRAPIVLDLIAEGEPAVGPLLAALATDDRLTRSLSGRGLEPTQPHLVADLIYATLQALLKNERFVPEGMVVDLKTPEGRRRLADETRAFWEKNRALSLPERRRRDLFDDQAGPTRWIEAAAGLIQPAGRDWSTSLNYSNLYHPARPIPGQARNGDIFRDLRDPSISDLMARRVAQIAEPGPQETIPDIKLQRASDLALLFASWDDRAALPTIKALMARNIERSTDPRQQNEGEGYYRYIGAFATVRARVGDLVALDEYAAWVKGIKPARVRFDWGIVLEPVWAYPDHPSIAEAARALFLDPKSPWLPLIPRADPSSELPQEQLVVSPLLVNPAFREAVLMALADRSPIGTVRRGSDGVVRLSITFGKADGYLESRPPAPGEKVDVDQPFRASDYLAWKLSAIDGLPDCRLPWPEGLRDRAVDACATFLRREGRRLSAEPPPGREGDPPQFPKAYLRTIAAPDNPAPK